MSSQSDRDSTGQRIHRRVTKSRGFDRYVGSNSAPISQTLPFQSWTTCVPPRRSSTFSSNCGIMRTSTGNPSPAAGSSSRPPAAR